MLNEMGLWFMEVEQARPGAFRPHTGEVIMDSRTPMRAGDWQQAGKDVMAAKEAAHNAQANRNPEQEKERADRAQAAIVGADRRYRINGRRTSDSRPVFIDPPRSLLREGIEGAVNELRKSDTPRAVNRVVETMTIVEMRWFTVRVWRDVSKFPPGTTGPDEEVVTTLERLIMVNDEGTIKAFIERLPRIAAYEIIRNDMGRHDFKPPRGGVVVYPDWH